MLRISRSSFLDWVYPPFCVLCDQSLRRGDSLCASCSDNLQPLPPIHCQTCGQGFDGNIPPPKSCSNCNALKPAFDFATAAWRSNDDSIQLIHQLKLIKRPEIGHHLARLAATSFRKDPRLSSLRAPLLIPVPLHYKRLRSRRFNQAQVLAEPLSECLQIPWKNALKRIHDTPRQATLTRKERLKNLTGAFRLNIPPAQLQDRDLVLIDDVFTTGSTAHECARTLRKESQPASIAIFAMVRA